MTTGRRLLSCTLSAGSYIHEINMSEYLPSVHFNPMRETLCGEVEFYLKLNFNG